MAEKIDIVINGIDNATKEIRGVSKSIDGLGDSVRDTAPSFIELNSALEIAKTAYGFLEKSYQSIIVPTIEYADQVDRLSTLTGDTTEESSYLLAAIDSLNIPLKTLTSSMEYAIKNGFDPSLEGLQKMREEYQNIQNPIAQSKYLMEKFGAAGADMAPLMKLSTDELARLIEKTDAVGLAMSGENIQAVKDYKRSMNDLETSINGVKIKLGNELIPHFLWLIQNGTSVENKIEDQKTKWMDWIPILGTIRDTIAWIQQLTNGLTDKTVTITTHYVNTYGSSYEDYQNQMGFASGANFIVPPGYPNDSFPMRVQSGEHVTVTPSGKSSPPGGGVTLVYSPMISLATLSEAENVLMPMLRKLQRAM